MIRVTFPCMLHADVITSKDMDNPLALFSNKLCQGQTACERELERLRADLDAEKNRTQRGFAHLSVELRQLREKAEHEHQRAVRELAARQKGQTYRGSQRCSHQVAAGSAGHRSKSAEREPLFLLGRETYAKLDHFLEALAKKIDGEQPIYKPHYRQRFEQDRAIFLYHLLKAYRTLLEDRRRAGHSGHSVETSSRKLPHEDRLSSCLIGPLQTVSFGVPLQGPRSPPKPSKHKQQEPPEGKAPGPADPRLPAKASDTCRGSARTLCHPPKAPHAGWTTQPPCCRSGESPPPRCTDRNMEVGDLIAPYATVKQMFEMFLVFQNQAINYDWAV